MQVRVQPGKAFNQTGPNDSGGRDLVTYAEGDVLDVSRAVYKKHQDVLEAVDFGDELSVSLENLDGPSGQPPPAELDDLPNLDEILAGVDATDGAARAPAPLTPEEHLGLNGAPPPAARPDGRKKPKRGNGPPKFGPPTGHA